MEQSTGGGLTVMQSLKFASRQVVLHPWLSAAVVLVLAVGISTTTAALSVFYQVVLRPIAAPEPERLVDLSETGMKPCRGAGLPALPFCSEAGLQALSHHSPWPDNPAAVAFSAGYPMSQGERARSVRVAG